jgi:hypothetical protein
VLRYLVPFTIGLAASATTNQATGWWLDSGRGVMAMLLVLTVISTLITSLIREPPTKPAISFWTGSLAGMIITLVWTGAGTIWPIVVVVAGLLSACAIVAGTLAGRAFGSRGTARR